MEKKTGTLEKLVIKCALAGVGFVIYEFGVFMHDNIFRRGYLNLLMLPIILIGVYLMAQPVIFILKPILGILSIFEVSYFENIYERLELEKEYKRLKYSNDEMDKENMLPEVIEKFALESYKMGHFQIGDVPFCMIFSKNQSL